MARLFRIARDAEATGMSSKEAVEITRKDFVYVPLHQQPITWASKKGVDLHQSPDNQLRLWLVTQR